MTPPNMSRHLLRLFVACVLFAQMILVNPAPAAARQRPRRVDLIVSGGTVVTMDARRRVIEDGAVAVAGGRIVAVGKRGEVVGRYAAREVVDASGRAVIPGLVNGHTHIPMTLF